MPTRTFAITADDKPVALDDKGAAELTINVSNTTAKPIRGQAKLVALGTTRAEWLRVSGEVERNFSASEAHQFVVRMTAPTGTPAGKYSFRLNVLSVQNPDDDFAEGPVVSFELREAKPLPPPNGKKFPWFLVILLLILVAGGAVVAVLLSGKTEVPVLVDRTLQDVTNELTKAGLSLTNVSFTNAGTSVPEHVASQIPEAGTKVKSKSGVAVVVREKPAPVLIRVPRVIGRDSVSAVNALVNARLAVTNLLTEATPRSNDWNLVIKQSPAPEQQVAAGTPVTLIIGTKQIFVRPITPRELMVDPSIFKLNRRKMVAPQ